MAIAVARRAPTTHPSWNRVSKRANDASARRHRGMGLDHRVEALAGDGGDPAEHERHQQHDGA